MTITELRPAEPTTAAPAPRPAVLPRTGAAAGALALQPTGAAADAPALFELTGTDRDRELVADLVRRSSPASLRSRFFLPGVARPEDVLRTYLPFLLAGPPDGVALVALANGGVVGVLNLVPGEGRRLELGVLVADAWQGQGVASSMLAHALRPGRWPGWTVRATVQPGNAAARGLIRAQESSHLVSGLRGEYVFEFPADDAPEPAEVRPAHPRQAEARLAR